MLCQPFSVVLFYISLLFLLKGFIFLSEKFLVVYLQNKSIKFWFMESEAHNIEWEKIYSWELMKEITKGLPAV